MEFIDIFSGMGTLRIGMELAGHKCVYSIEKDRNRRKIYKVLFDREPEGRDVFETTSSEIPRADCWCFGFPCTDFSMAGKRKGFKGNSGNCFSAVIKLLQETEIEYRPKYLFIENVKHLKTIDNGFGFLQVILELEQCGYYVEWQLINSEVVVPHNRERVYIVGHKKDINYKPIFPLEIKGDKCTVLEEILDKNAADKYKIRGKKLENILQTIKKENIERGFENTGQIQAVINPKRGKIRQSKRCKLPKKPSYCITSMDRHGIYNGKEVRIFTPGECCRLQGIPDVYIQKLVKSDICNDEAMFKAIGLGCTVPIIYHIVKKMSI